MCKKSLFPFCNCKFALEFDLALMCQEIIDFKKIWIWIADIMLPDDSYFLVVFATFYRWLPFMICYVVTCICFRSCVRTELARKQ